MNTKEMICIVCPIGCHLNISSADGSNTVQGNKCERGKKYAIDELTNPLRTVTSTVKINDADISRLPVKTEKPFPKGKIFELMNVLKDIEIQSPVTIRQIILKNVLFTNIDIVATKTINKLYK